MRNLINRIIPFHKYLRDIEKEILLGLNPDFSGLTLDAGCGDGRFFRDCFSNTMSGAGKRGSIGLDTNPKNLKTARNVYEHVVAGDILHLPFREETFREIICNSVLEHIPNSARKSLSEFSRVSTEEALLHLSTPNGNSHPCILKLSTAIFRHPTILSAWDWEHEFFMAGYHLSDCVNYQEHHLHALYVVSLLFPFLWIPSILFIKLLERIDSFRMMTFFFEGVKI